MSMTLHIIATMATLLAVDAFFLPDCLWDVDSWDIPERNPVSRRYRRFLWDDSDVCDWMCDPDLLPHEICNTCCRKSTATQRSPVDNAQSLQSAISSSQFSFSNPISNAQPSSGMADKQLALPQSNTPVQVQLSVAQETPLMQSKVQIPPVGLPNNQNWLQPSQQNQNWPQPSLQSQNWLQPSQQSQNWPQPSQQNQNWLQASQQNQNGPQPSLQNQNWPQPPQQSQNWLQPSQQNPSWPQPSLQSLGGFIDNRIPFNQNGPIQTVSQVYAVSPMNNEPLSVQVPINLTGLFQAQVPSRLSTIFNTGTQLPPQNGQNQNLPLSIQAPIQTQIPQNAPLNGNGGSSGQRQSSVRFPNIEAVPVTTQSQSTQTSPTNGNGGSGIVQSVVNWMAQPFSQPENEQGNQAQSQVPVPPAQTQQELLTDGQQQTQSDTAPQQQFQMAGDQPIQPPGQSPQTQNQAPLEDQMAVSAI